MNTVEPIRDKDKVMQIYNYLKERNERDSLLFFFGIYTGLRVSDILKFKVKDCYKKGYNIREKKTGKQKIVDWNPYLARAIRDYISDKDADDYLFKSRQGGAISRQRAYQIIRKACNANNVYNVGTHTMRKTFGYHTYQMTKDVAMLMDMFNHAAPEITLRYIGISNEKNNSVIKKLRY